jgi:hypothetical protein
MTPDVAKAITELATIDKKRGGSIERISGTLRDKALNSVRLRSRRSRAERDNAVALGGCAWLSDHEHAGAGIDGARPV